MRKLYSLLILFFYCLSMSYANKLALLVGISNYPKQSNWVQLNATNDVALLSKTYQILGFKKENILLVENEKATKMGIMIALEQLLAKAKVGDIIVFHFSGHGQQVMDKNGDEIDAYDESIVPFDAPKDFKKGIYEGEKHILDEELGSFLEKIQTKITKSGQLFVSLDACHSGSGTRSLTTARGTDKPLAPTQYIIEHKQKSILEKVHLSQNIDKQQLAPMVTFFSASPNELSYEFTDQEGKLYGSFSRALANALLQAKINTNYQTLFDCIKNNMNTQSSLQNPHYEGDINQSLFNNNFSTKVEYLKIKEKINNNLILLDAGILQGVNEGSEIVFYPAETYDTLQMKPVAIGKVKYAEIFNADVQIEQGNIPKNTNDIWAFIRKKSYATLKAGLRLDLKDDNMKDLIVNKYKTQPFLTIVNKEEDLLMEKTENHLRLIAKDGELIFKKELEQNTPNQYSGEMLNEIESWLRAKFLKQIEIQDNNFNASLNIIGTHNNRVKLGDKIKLKISNQGEIPFYFSVLDIQPDNQINVLLPFGRPAIDYYLPAGKTYETEFELNIQPPIGKDMLKLICSAQALDLSNLISTRGSALSKNANPFEQILAHSYKVTRGGNVTISPKAVSVSSFLFEIVEK